MSTEKKEVVVTRKVLILFCGGTITMEKKSDGSLAPFAQEKVVDFLRQLEPHIFQEIDTEIRILFHQDSSNMTPKVWDDIAQTVATSYDAFDGFVVIHGTDTMAFTSAALSFALQNLGKPVVLTGAQIPGIYMPSDAGSNFAHAMRLAIQDVSGVFLVFGCSVFRGTRVTKISYINLEGFMSVGEPALGRIGEKMVLASHIAKRHDGILVLQKGFDHRIQITHLFPGLMLDYLFSSWGKESQGVILIGYGTGNLAEPHLPFLALAQEKKVPVLIRTQCIQETTDMAIYELGKKALAYGAIETFDMSLESTVTKLMWALDKKVPYSKMKEVIQKSIAGEISQRKEQ